MKGLLAVLYLLPALAFAGDHNDHDLSWLAGCWVTPDNTEQEVWVIEDDRSLTGLSVVVANDRVAFYEVLSIRQGDDGLLHYTAHPSGQEATSFVLAGIEENRVVFTNPAHDYPQQIEYVRDGNRLTATISLLDGANPRTFDKIACDQGGQG